jgi:hypothetical protein
MKNTNGWIPEIMYEDDENGMTSKIPFIMVPKEEEMPSLLFMFESRETGEFEPDNEGNPLPIIEMELHQYADMAKLKTGLSEDLYDQVRMCLGLEPLRQSAKKGMQLTDKIRNNLK